MYYFKFDIGTMPDGSRIRYPPGWFGSMAFPEGIVKTEDVCILFYNDLDGYGIARTENDFILKAKGEFEIIDEKTALTDFERIKTIDHQQIYFGEKITHRWDGKPTAYCKSLTIDFNAKTWPKPPGYSYNLEGVDSKPSALPKYLVKNLEKAYIEKFKDTGEVLVSSIARFRTIGSYGRDEKEGIKSTDICIDLGGPTQFKATDLGRFISYFKLAGTGTIEVNEKLIIKDKNFLLDAYVFCASYKPLNEFGGSNYNIINVSRFAQTLFESIRKEDNEVYYWMMAPVIYGGAKDTIKTLEELKNLGNYNINIAAMLDCFVKPSSFKDEEEFRLVFFTKKHLDDDRITIHNKNRFSCVMVYRLYNN